MEELQQFPVAGTSEPNALIFSNRAEYDLSYLHSFGIHSIPHIGVYGANYAVALPMFLVSLKPTTDILSQVPFAPLAALDIDLQAINDSFLRPIAQDLVTKVLASASKCVNNYFSWRDHQELTENLSGRIRDKGTPSTPDYIRNETPLSSDNENERNSVDDDCDFKNDIADYDEEQILRKIAQKLVRKVLHAACTFLEPVNRTSSIEELLTVTKKLKISVSPSYTPPLQPEEFHDPHFQFDKTDHANDNDIEPNKLTPNSCFSVGSQVIQQVPHKSLGKKRQRSASHEANMECEIEKIRFRFQAKLQLSNDNRVELERVKDHDEKVVKENMVSATSVDPKSVASMVSEIRKLSIMEVESENDEDDEGDTILEAVTKPLATITDNCKEDLSCVGTSKGHVRFSSEEAQSVIPPQIYPQSFVLPNLDYYIIVHSFPPPSECQKFLCSNRDEVNLMFHCWLFRDMPLDPAISVVEKMEMGIFEPQGISPVHLNLVDSGIPFHYLEPRTVCVHDLCFSPENAQLQLSSTSSKFRSFFSVGSYQNRRVLTFHVLPSTKTVENELSLILQQCDGSLSKFLGTICLELPDLGNSMIHLMKPIL